MLTSPTAARPIVHLFNFIICSFDLCCSVLLWVPLGASARCESRNYCTLRPAHRNTSRPQIAFKELFAYKRRTRIVRLCGPGQKKTECIERPHSSMAATGWQELFGGPKRLPAKPCLEQVD